MNVSLFHFLAVFVSILTATTAPAFQNARKSDKELSALSWAEVVDYYLQTFERPNDPETKVYTDRLRTLLDREGISRIRSYAIVDGDTSASLYIYYQPGELHVVDSSAGKNGEPGNWNLLVKDGKAHEWRTGESEGIVSDAIDRDLVDYLIYLTDVSLISTSIYRDYQRKPESFLPPMADKNNGWTELRLKEANEIAISTLFVSQDPFWICGFEMKNEGSVIRLIHDPPQSTNKMPADLFAPLDKIDFKESKASLRRHLLFL